MIRTCERCGKGLVNRGSICDLCVCGGETIHSFWKCSGCNSCFYNDYYDCWGSERPDDLWFEISESAFHEGVQRISACPERSRKYCDCPLHPFSIDLKDARKLP
jgi:hypothetical protein